MRHAVCLCAILLELLEVPHVLPQTHTTIAVVERDSSKMCLVHAT